MNFMPNRNDESRLSSFAEYALVALLSVGTPAATISSMGRVCQALSDNPNRLQSYCALTYVPIKICDYILDDWDKRTHH
jgi:hypothetical protein